MFDALKKLQILVVGDVMLDKYIRGSVSRISPEAPVPIVELASERYHFGGAANVALNLSRLGCQAQLIGMIGKDQNGAHFQSLLREENISDSGLVKTSDRPTTVKTRIIGDGQHMVRVDREQIIYDNPAIDDLVIQKFDELVSEVDAVILEDYNKGLLGKKVIQHILAVAGNRGLITTIDPKFVNFSTYKNATVFKPNIKETAQALAREIQSDSEVEAAGAELLKLLNAENILLTRGAQGLTIFQANGEIEHISAQTRKVADVSGAGDTVIATLTAFLAAGNSLLKSAKYANYAAGLVCSEVGIVPVNADELKQEILRKN